MLVDTSQEFIFTAILNIVNDGMSDGFTGMTWYSSLLDFMFFFNAKALGYGFVVSLRAFSNADSAVGTRDLPVR